MNATARETLTGDVVGARRESQVTSLHKATSVGFERERKVKQEVDLSSWIVQIPKGMTQPPLPHPLQLFVALSVASLSLAITGGAPVPPIIA